jgi:hypothetical protein
MLYEMEKHQNLPEIVYSKKLIAGNRRTYFIDVLKTYNNEHKIKVTESIKTDDGYFKRHTVQLFKEDFNMFLKMMEDAIEHVKTELQPDFDYDTFNRYSKSDSESES